MQDHALPVRNRLERAGSLIRLGQKVLSYIRSRMAVNTQDRLDSFYQAWCEYLYITADDSNIGQGLERRNSLEA
jgi:hypothetical protein